MISTIRSTSLEPAPRIVTTSHYRVGARDNERRGHVRACVREELLGHSRSPATGAHTRTQDTQGRGICRSVAGEEAWLGPESAAHTARGRGPSGHPLMPIWDTDDKNGHGATSLRAMTASAYEERVCSRHDAHVTATTTSCYSGRRTQHSFTRSNTHTTSPSDAANGPRDSRAMTSCL